MKNPLGVYVALPGDDSNIDNEPCWTDPNIKGVLLRSHWNTVEPNQSQYNWSYFDHGMALCRLHNKQAMMSVNGSVGGTPGWLYALGAKSFPLANGANTPAPWDPYLIQFWTHFVTTWGARYDSNDLLASVTMWAGGKAIECFFADNPADQATLDALGGPSLWLSGAERLIDAFNAFGTTPAYLATGTPYQDLGTTMTTLVDWMANTYGRGAGWNVQANALSPNYPSGHDFPHTKLSFAQVEAIGPIGYQLVGPVTGGETLSQILNNGLNYGAKWVQVYPGDPATDPGEASIIAFNKAVGA